MKRAAVPKNAYKVFALNYIAGQKPGVITFKVGQTKV